MPSGLHNWSKTAASNNTADSAVNWSEGQAPSSVNDSARAMMAVVAKWRDDNNGSLATGGTSTAFTLTTNTVFTSLALMDNATIAFIPHTDSGATPTLNVDSLGAKTIRNWTGATFPTGGLKSGSVYRATYDNGNGEWLIQNSAGVLQANQVTTASITDAAVTLAKLANLAQNTIIGRYTASTGVPQALTLSTGLDVDSSTGNVTTTISSATLSGFLSGLELSTAGSSATFGIAVGSANDVGLSDMMVLGSAYTKTTSAWAVGTGNGALDSGTIANNTWYHVYLIKRSDTGVVDVLVSTSASSPTMPTSYDRKRRIGSMKTNGSAQWTAFFQTGDEFIWAAMVDDAKASVGTVSRSTAILSGVPTGVVVAARFRSYFNSPGSAQSVMFTALTENDVAVGSTVADLAVASLGVAAGNFEKLTNTSAQIGVRSGAGTITAPINVYGWKDFRGR